MLKRNFFAEVVVMQDQGASDCFLQLAKGCDLGIFPALIKVLSYQTLGEIY